tara:strand:+ start:21579 stop:21794 length:216 start_codon:yes stop_codon:yes gene_type:complete
MTIYMPHSALPRQMVNGQSFTGQSRATGLKGRETGFAGKTTAFESVGLVFHQSSLWNDHTDKYMLPLNKSF